MALAPGTRLGPYEIVAPLGAGGMGEVYTASDARLGRKVALKIISRTFASDPDRVRRFEQEARAAAAVTHPALLSVYDIGTDNGQPFIVSELLEGTSLRDRIPADGLPASRVVALGLQIAQGLAAAHDRGVVHRDLKPENIFVTADGRAKILDFGLAKLTQADVAPAGATMTALPGDTQPGLVLGTMGYMAPEQVRGHGADARSDIFSFGAILYEMTSGRRAFAGETMADTMSAILAEEPPDITSSVHAVPPGLQQIVRHCLEKTPEQRFQSARDLAFALEAISTSSGTTIVPLPQGRVPAAARLRAWQALAALSTIAAVALASALLLWRPPEPDDPAVAVVSVLDDDGLPPDASTRAATALSPDGRFIAAARRGADQTLIWIRPLDGSPPYALDATGGVASGQLLWSPDSRSIAFEATDAIKRVDLDTRTAQTIASADAGRVVAWSQTGVILLIRVDGLYRVPDSGGTPQAARTVDHARGDALIAPGGFLPDGRHFVYTLFSADATRAGLWVGSLDGPDATRVLPGDTSAGVYVPPGFLLVTRGSTILARRFDPVRLVAGAAEIPIASNVLVNAVTRRALFSASSVGSLLIRVAGSETARFDTYDSSGRRMEQIGLPDRWVNFSVAPDGRRIAANVADALGPAQHISTIDRTRNVTTTLTLGDARDSDPVWSPDGERIAFSSASDTAKTLYMIPAAGGAKTRVGTIGVPFNGGLDAWSPDGQYLLAHTAPARLIKVPLNGGPPITLADVASIPDEAEWSPDGRWITYNSNDTGRSEVYAIPDPPTGQRWQLSSAGGFQGRWSRDGHHVFYLDPSGMLMQVDLPTGRPTDASSPRPLFQTSLSPSPQLDQYRVLPDGTFLIEDPSASNPTRQHALILNWPTLVHARERGR